MEKSTGLRAGSAGGPGGRVPCELSSPLWPEGCSLPVTFQKQSVLGWRCLLLLSRDGKRELSWMKLNGIKSCLQPRSLQRATVTSVAF